MIKKSYYNKILIVVIIFNAYYENFCSLINIYKKLKTEDILYTKNYIIHVADDLLHYRGLLLFIL